MVPDAEKIQAAAKAGEEAAGLAIARAAPFLGSMPAAHAAGYVQAEDRILYAAFVVSFQKALSDNPVTSGGVWVDHDGFIVKGERS